MMNSLDRLTRAHLPARLLLIVLLACLVQGCKTQLYTNLSEREANSMLSALLHKGIAAERVVQKDGRLTVNVDEDRFAEAISVLEQAGLPEQTFATMGDIFKSNGLVSSPTQERAQLIYALSEELAHTVSEVDGVLSARVHVVLPDNDLLKRTIAPSSASVFIRYEEGLDINTLIPQIKTLVAKGISGLSYDGVSVIPIKAAARQQSTDTPAFSSILGVWVLDGSRSRAWLLLGSMLLAILALASALAYVLWSTRQPRHYRLAPTT
jgi:type III secretion protein J